MLSMQKVKTREAARTTLHLDPEQHRRLRVLAAQKGTTMTECVTEALEAYLRREEPKQLRKETSHAR
jgi:hypothetical protein